MRYPRAFTVVELLAVICIVTLLVALLLPALGAAREAEDLARSAEQIHNIHAGMTIYAQGNDGWFPGRTAAAEATTRQTVTLGHPQSGLHVQSRYRELLEDRFFTGGHAVAPGDKRVPWTSGNVLLEHYSYAMLAMEQSTGYSPKIRFKEPALNSPIGLEWRETSNAEAVVISDRALGNGATALKSIHTNPPADATDWRGHVGWNDGHVTFENAHVVKTRYLTKRNNADSLFNTSDGLDNAMLIWHHHVATAHLTGTSPAVVRPFHTAATHTPTNREP